MAERRVEYVVIGGGVAGFNCARWLRESGGEGEVLVIGRELDPPYDRSRCSKGYLEGKESLQDIVFRPPEWYAEQRVEVLTRTSASSLDLSEHTAELSNGDVVRFDQALIATGANVRRLNVEGCELEGIYYLRTLRNSDAIRDGAGGKRVVLIGGSYIASEVAASLTSLGSDCTMVMLESVALSRTFGEQAGRFFQGRLEEHGVTVIGDDQLERFEGQDGRVTRVITGAGRELDADAVVIGAGVAPEVTLARNAGLELGDAGGVRADSRLQTAARGIYVAGDIAEYESAVHGGRTLRIEHWDVAFNQGKTAALNMLGQDKPHDVVPYFFSDLSDWASLEYIGPAYQWDEEVVRGSLEDGEFTIFYLDQGRVAAALTVGRSDDLGPAEQMLRSGVDLRSRVQELKDPSSDLASL